MKDDAGELSIGSELDSEFDMWGIKFKISSEWNNIGSTDDSIGYSLPAGTNSLLVVNATGLGAGITDSDLDTIADNHSSIVTKDGLSTFQIYETDSDGRRQYAYWGVDEATGTGFGISVLLDEKTWNEDNYKLIKEMFSSVTFDASQFPTPTFADTTLSNLSSFEATSQSGSGDSVVDMPSADGYAVMDIEYSGSGNFAVWTLDSSGEKLDLLVNTIGAYSGTVTDFFGGSASMLSVTVDGDWNINIKPMNEMQKFENGASGTGDAVGYIDTDSITKLNITNDGDSNFVVRAVGTESSDLLVNEIGSYNGTVVWTQEQAIITITSNGNWSLSWS